MTTITRNAVLSVWMPSTLAERIRDFADEDSRSISSLVRLAMTEYLDRRDGGEGAHLR